jgi:hypothetical protein
MFYYTGIGFVLCVCWLVGHTLSISLTTLVYIRMMMLFTRMDDNIISYGSDKTTCMYVRYLCDMTNICCDRKYPYVT